VFWRGNLRKRKNLVDLSVDGEIILKCILKKSDGGLRPDWLEIQTGGGLL
jgi:hypothetical protein